METSELKKFAQSARRGLIEQVYARLKLVLVESSEARREKADAVSELEKSIGQHGKEWVVDRVAYIWFNRFCALRFMDVNRYTRIGVVSPAEGQSQPEILAEAKMGHIDAEMVPEKTRQQIFALLGGKAPSRDPQGEAYRLLLVAACNYWNRAMPFLFERIDDFTELLMPGDLLSGNSILAHTREAMTPDACQDVEVIGWLYQFYISEKKAEVFEGLKRNKKIRPEDIPAATQLFTPHWIVRYLVQNSLGRLWMLSRPNSRLIEQMDYYIKPEEPGSDFLRISKPEEIKLCDPACGSGHMLVYAFDLLYAIYEEEGYEPAEIPEKILTHNLYGIEIDERSGELAALALAMKARAKQRRFFRKPVQPNICVLENISFGEDELKEYMDFVGLDLFTAPLLTTLHQFQEADNFGSLIRPGVTDPEDMLKTLDSKDVSGQLLLSSTHQKVLQALKQADYLSPKYHVVIANPPYMGGNGMNGRLAAWLKDSYEDAKSDLFSAFIVRNTELAVSKGQLGFMTPFVWMFISSYEKLRSFLLDQKTITSLVQLEYSGFGGATVPICTFTLENSNHPEFRGGFVRLSDFRGAEKQGPRTRDAISDPSCGWFYRASAADFKKIPGSPIAFWISERLRNVFSRGVPLEQIAEPRKGMVTADNPRFIRLWTEVNVADIGFNYGSRAEAGVSSAKWFPYMKGGSFRRWSGNMESVVNWENDGYELLHMKEEGYKVGSTNHNLDYIFKPAITWTKVTSSDSGFRNSNPGFLFDDASGLCPVRSVKDRYKVLGLLNSPVTMYMLRALNPTLNLQPGNLAGIPFVDISTDSSLVRACEVLSRSDWDAFETSWDFKSLPLLHPDHSQTTLEATYQKLRAHWRKMTREMQRLEEENNRIFIDGYDLQGELTPEVPLKEITLTCNPHYRYSGGKSEEELEALLLADTIKEFLSYAVGCMFGRYALEEPGLVLANQGENIADYLKRVPEPSFPAADDNVIPILDGDWFPDDISERFRKFLRRTFGEEHFEANLKFVEEALRKDIRNYFLKDFYNDHVRRYKKRPIYWLFSSPKGSFNALIYMHRCLSDTVSVVLNDYLREFRAKLMSRLDHLKRVETSADASRGEKTKALKEIESLKRIIDELDTWEREVLYPLAAEQVEIDLDDGVKANYARLGAALKKIPGLDAKEG